MKPQYQHEVLTSFMLWFDNHLLNKGEAYSNKTGTLYYFDDSRLPDNYKVYASPYKQWVNDSSVTGSTNPIIPTGFMGSGRNDGVIFDFENGRIIETGGNFGTSSTITGTFAVKDFNVYVSDETEEDLILESKFILNSRYNDSETGIKPYDKVIPAVFVNSENVQNVPYAFGGEDETRTSIKAVVLAENNYQLDGVLSIFADLTKSNITPIPFSGHPSTEYGDLKTDFTGAGFYYTGVIDAYKNNIPYYIEDVTVSKLSEREKPQQLGDVKVGFIDFDLRQARFPRL